MADLLKTSQVLAQVESDLSPKLKVSQVLSQVEADLPPKLKVSQLLIQVECEMSLPSPSESPSASPSPMPAEAVEWAESGTGSFVVDGLKVRDVFPNVSGEIDDDCCIPLPFGVCYIPIRSAYIDTDRYYILGPTDSVSGALTYTITKTRTPRDYSVKVEYTLDQTQSAIPYAIQDTKISDKLYGNSFKVFQPYLTALACSIYPNGDNYYDLPTQFSRSDTVSITNPADVIKWVLIAMGVDSDAIDDKDTITYTSSFTTAKATYDTLGISINGAFWKVVTREKALTTLLTMCNSVLLFTDTIQLQVLNTTLWQEIASDDIIKMGETGVGTFTSSKLERTLYDSGNVNYSPKDSTTGELDSQDLPATAVVAAGSETRTISPNAFDMMFTSDEAVAKSAARLYYQRTLWKKATEKFTAKSSCLALQPSDFIRILGNNYGGDHNAMIDSMTINKDVSIQFTCVTFTNDLDGTEFGWSPSMSPSRSPSMSPSASESPSASPSAIVGSPSKSPSMSPSLSPSASMSPSASLSPSASMSPSASPSEIETIEGTSCWGQTSGVIETNTRSFSGYWTGTATIVGAGDAEYISMINGQYLESEVIKVNSRVMAILSNVYASGNTPIIKYRTAALPSLIEAESWSTYSAPFVASDYMQIRIEATDTWTVEDIVLRDMMVSASPSESPSMSPSLSPSASESPSESPSLSPSASESPSFSPSESPSASESPSISPSLSPSASESPSISPSASPSESPSLSPSLSPSASASPSLSPSLSPSASASPSVSPSVSGSESPSYSPSKSMSPSSSPSKSPSASPSVSPSASPSKSPSASPSVSPSNSPSASPSISPSGSPSESPSFSPSLSPSASESPSASISPSNSPSASPSVSPSASPSIVPPNDFSEDGSAKAYWFIDSTLTADNKGTNTLTLGGSVASPVPDTSIVKTGSASASFDGGDYAYITDANLDTGFPLKNGDAVKKGTICFWYRHVSNVASAKVFSKWSASGNKRSFAIEPGDSTNYGVIDWGYNSGASAETHTMTWKPSNKNRWYHYSVAFDGIAKTIHVRVWGDVEGGVVLDQTFTPANELNVSDAAVYIGTETGLTPLINGKLNAMVVFNRVLSSTEMDLVSSGDYAASPSSSPSISPSASPSESPSNSPSASPST